MVEQFMKSYQGNFKYLTLKPPDKDKSKTFVTSPK